MRPRVLIVDDSADFRRAARLLLEASGFTVVGEADDGTSAVSRSRELSPSLVLLDIQLPDTDGFAVAHLLAALPDPPAVVLTSSRDALTYRRRLTDSPARGFIAKAELTGRALTALLG